MFPHLTMAAQASPPLGAVVAIAAWLIYMCLKTICTDMEYALRWHNLQVDAQVLRQRQIQRLKELALKDKSAPEEPIEV